MFFEPEDLPEYCGLAESLIFSTQLNTFFYFTAYIVS